MAIRARREPLLTARSTAFPHQVAAVEVARELEYSAIFHEQGLGKTKIALDLAVSWLAGGVVDSVLIITKKALIENWRREVRTHSFIAPAILGQDKKHNFNAFNSPSRLYLTHYEVCITEFSRMRLFQKTRRVGVILDESQKIKNPQSKLTEALQGLSAGFTRRVIMTGTPVANRPYDLWSQIRFLDGGKALGGDFVSFKAAHDLKKEMAYDKTLRQQFEKALDQLFAKISAFAIRETKTSAGLELPGKHYRSVVVEMEDRQAELYQMLRNDLRATVERQGSIKEEAVDSVLKRLLRLVQVASNPRMVDESYDREPGKLPHLVLLLDDIVDAGEKAIVWTGFVENADWLANELRRYGTRRVHGHMAIADRNLAIAAFLDDPSCRVLVATPGAAKEGFTLTTANHAIFFDRSFSLDDYLQAQDRIHRISQKRECFIYNLVARDTVDEWVEELLAAKHLAAGLAQGDLALKEYRNKATYEFGRILERVLEVKGAS